MKMKKEKEKTRIKFEGQISKGKKFMVLDILCMKENILI